MHTNKLSIYLIFVSKKCNFYVRHLKQFYNYLNIRTLIILYVKEKEKNLAPLENLHSAKCIVQSRDMIFVFNNKKKLQNVFEFALYSEFSTRRTKNSFQLHVNTIFSFGFVANSV